MRANRQNRRLTFTLCLGLLAFVVGCPEEADDAALPPAGLAGGTGAGGDGAVTPNERRSKIASLPMDEVIVTVNGLELTRADLERVVAHRASQLGAAPNKIPPMVRDELEQMAYDSLVRRGLFYQEAKRRGLAATDEQVASQQAKLEAAIPEGRSIDEVLKMMHTDRAGLKKDIGIDLSIGNLQKARKAETPQLTDADARKIYDAEGDRFVAGETASVSEILIELAPDAPPAQVDEARAKADKLKAELEGKDAAAFAQAAKDNKGGDQGWFEKRSKVPEYGAVAFGLKKGEISRPFRTNKGFFILRGQGVKKGKKMSFEEAKPRILAIEGISKRAETDRAFTEALRSKATIVRHHEPVAPTRLAEPAQPMPGMPGMPGPPGMPGMPGMGANPGAASMPGMPGAGGGHMQMPLPSADNVLPGAPNPHANPGGASSKPASAPAPKP